MWGNCLIKISHKTAKTTSEAGVWITVYIIEN